MNRLNTARSKLRGGASSQQQQAASSKAESGRPLRVRACGANATGSKKRAKLTTKQKSLSLSLSRNRTRMSSTLLFRPPSATLRLPYQTSFAVVAVVVVAQKASWWLRSHLRATPVTLLQERFPLLIECSLYPRSQPKSLVVFFWSFCFLLAKGGHTRTQVVQSAAIALTQRYSWLQV